MGELRNKAIKGIFWSAIDKIGVRAISFIVSIVIARILSPADYGIIGMILVFIAIAYIFIDSGMSQAIVQKQDRTKEDLSTAFIFNVVVSVICYLILFLCAPLIARFYNEPILIKILRILGLNIIIASFATVQRANLIVKLDFKTISFVNLASVIASGIVGIGMAYNGMGVWALVGQQLTSISVSTLTFWLSGKWFPKTFFSYSSFQKLWKFGSKLLITGIYSTIIREINSIAIGKFYRPTELGLYTRAVQTSDMVSITANEVINAVSFPILSSLQKDKEHLISVYSKMLGMTAYIVFPLMTLLAVIAKPFISVLLTDKWILAVPLLQWLCFARMFTPISGLNMNILNAVGRSDLFMKVDFSKLPLTILVMVITIPIGTKAIVIGSFISSFLCYFINAFLPGRMFNFGVKAQFKIFYKILIATAMMAFITYVGISFVHNNYYQLFIGIFIAVLSYLCISYILKINQLQEIKLELARLWNKNIKKP